MRIDIAMPKLADSMTEGGVVSWLKGVGETVAAGDAIAEIETDKSTVDLEAPQAGVFAGIAVAAGTQHIAVGTVLAWIETDAAAAVAAAPVAAAGTATAAPAATPAVTPAAAAPPAPPAAGAQPEGEAAVSLPTAPGAAAPIAAPAPATPPAAAPSPPVVAAAPPPAAVAPPTNGSAIRATPLAARMAAQAGIELGALQATGIGGKICKADVEAALGRPATTTEAPANGSAAKSPAPTSPPPAASARNSAASARIRRVTGERMSLSKQTIPHFYLSVDCCVDRLLEARARLNADADGYKLSLNDFVLKATAAALKRVPEANSAWVDGAVRSQPSIDIAVAVALDEGLVTPILRSADTKGLADISREVSALAEKARAGRLTPADYDGATFTVSNLGMYGVGSLYAIINPPQACILGVGAAEQKPVVRDGAVAVGTVMTLTISADHRILDGATGARLLADIRRSLEEPTRMLL